MADRQRRELFIDHEHMYALTQDFGGQLFLEVVCGGIAMENVIVPLGSAGTDSYSKEGKSFLDRLALKVCKNRKAYPHFYE